jgi:hypothetical protein
MMRGDKTRMALSKGINPQPACEPQYSTRMESNTVNGSAKVRGFDRHEIEN